MKRRIWTVATGLAAVAALVAVPAAMAAYSSAKLQVTRTATGVIVKATLDPNDDPTARVGIVAPNGTQLTTSQAPGTVLGPVKAVVKALDLAGADLPLDGQLIVAAPGQVPAASQTACLGAATPIATWLMVLSAAGQTLTVPTYLVPTSGSTAPAGPAFIAICLPPPDVPASTPGRATFGAKVYSAELTINGVFSAVTSGAWLSTWVPYKPGAGTPNPAAVVVAPAGIAPGAVSIRARKVGTGALVTGAVTQGGQGRGGAVVAIWGAKGKAALKPLGKAKVSSAGVYAFRAKTGDSFQARVVAAAGSSAAVCTQVQPLIGATPCVNPTVNGFSAKSALAKKK